VLLRVPSAATVPGGLTVRAAISRRAAAHDNSGFIVLTRGSATRRIPYWLRVSVPRLGRDPHTLLRRPGLYHGDTRGRRALVSSYRYPAAPGGLGVAARLPGPEQVFRFVLRKRVTNAGAVIVSSASGSQVTPRLVRAGSEDELTGYTALPIRLNTYQPDFFGRVPAVGVFRPTPGAYDLVFDTPSRRRGGRFTFRFWVNDTSPPRVRLLTRSVGRGGRIAVRVTDRGSGVDRSSLVAQVDGKTRRIAYSPSAGLARIQLGALGAGRHRLVFTAADYQETKNNENGPSILPNTRRLVTTFTVR
jgi:hypothetical protein